MKTVLATLLVLGASGILKQAEPVLSKFPIRRGNEADQGDLDGLGNGKGTSRRLSENGGQASYRSSPNSLVVDTLSGKVEGKRYTAANGKPVDVWWGIPYAEPPLGKLRFMRPVPVENWGGVKKAQTRPNSCVQITDTMFQGFPGSEMWNPNTNMSEDCLYLNIAVPVPRPNNSAVMVWIYGGSFYSGTSTLDVYDPKTLASEQNIIVASLQYRVASLGFLYLGTEDAAGNQGLLDQRMAIQWISDNVRAFGGNPDNITLFSESAGSASVAFHLLSPGSRGLFSQAILQSAAATNPWAMITRKEAQLRAMRLAEILHCPHNLAELGEVARCLREAQATDMVNAEWDGIVFGMLGCPFIPVLDGEFFPDSPARALSRKNFKRTSILLGSNSHEGNYFLIYYLTDIFKKQESVSMSREEYVDAVKELNLFVSPVGLHAISYEYTNWLDPDNSTLLLEAVDKLVGDYQFTCPVQEFAQTYASIQLNVYLYHFSHRSSQNLWPKWAGVLHADEINYVFGEPLNTTHFNYTEQEIALSKTIMSYWSNFAKTGNPNTFPNGTWMSVYWPLHTARNKEYLELSVSNMTRGKGYRARKCAFWQVYLPNLLANEPATECQASKPACESGQEGSSPASSCPDPELVPEQSVSAEDDANATDLGSDTDTAATTAPSASLVNMLLEHIPTSFSAGSSLDRLGEKQPKSGEAPLPQPASRVGLIGGLSAVALVLVTLGS